MAREEHDLDHTFDFSKGRHIDPKRDELTEGTRVLANPAGTKKWLQATILWTWRTPDHEDGPAYEVQFRDGSRGGFDLNHLKLA